LATVGLSNISPLAHGWVRARRNFFLVNILAHRSIRRVFLTPLGGLACSEGVRGANHLRLEGDPQARQDERVVHEDARVHVG